MEIKPILLILAIFLVSGVTALQSLGTFQQGEDVNLIQSCDNSTYSNISRITYPNSTFLLDAETIMNSTTNDNYNYTLTNSDTPGPHIVYGHCDEDLVDTQWVYDYEITSTGLALTTQMSILYIGLLAVLVFIFILMVLLISVLPSDNNRGEEGEIISINNLKFLRPVIWISIYGIIAAIMFITSNIALAYISSGMIGSFLFMIYKVMMWLAIPLLVIYVVYIIAKIFQDKEVKNLIERGVQVGGDI